MHTKKSTLPLLATLAFAACSASAQTNAALNTPNPLPAAVSTNGLLVTTNALQTLTNSGPARAISLQECFDLALKNNLTLQIERINPLISEQALFSARGYYDPTIGTSYNHNHSASGGGVQNGVPNIAFVNDTDTFSGAGRGPFLSGSAGPFGTTYGVSATTSATEGTSPNSSSSVNANLTQPLLKNFLYNSGQYNIDLAKNDIKLTKQQLLFQIMTVLNQVEQAYYDLIYSRESIRVSQMALELAIRSLEENRKKVQIGVMAPLEEKQSESQVAARQTDLTSALRNYNTAQNNLKKLITAHYRDLHAERLEPTIGLIAVPSIIDLHDSWSRALTQRPDLLEARLSLERQNITLKYNKNQLLPELDINGTYGYNGSSTKNRDGSGGEFANSLSDLTGTTKANWTAGASVTYPLFNRAARGRYNQSKLSVEQALLNLKSREEAVLVQVDEDINQLKSAWAQVASTKANRVYAEEALAAEQKKLEAGKSTSFVVLSLQNDLTSARYNEISALANYNKIQSQLAFDEGQTLSRNALKIEIK